MRFARCAAGSMMDKMIMMPRSRGVPPIKFRFLKHGLTTPNSVLPKPGG